MIYPRGWGVIKQSLLIVGYACLTTQWSQNVQYNKISAGYYNNIQGVSKQAMNCGHCKNQQLTLSRYLCQKICLKTNEFVQHGDKSILCVGQSIRGEEKKCFTLPMVDIIGALGKMHLKVLYCMVFHSLLKPGTCLKLKPSLCKH